MFPLSIITVSSDDEPVLINQVPVTPQLPSHVPEGLLRNMIRINVGRKKVVSHRVVVELWKLPYGHS